jgi:SAM-dependent methyltransferase
VRRTPPARSPRRAQEWSPALNEDYPSCCPTCGSTAVRAVGELPEPTGAVLAVADTLLWACRSCGLSYRVASLRGDGLPDAYALLDQDHWRAGARPDHDLVRSVLVRRLERGAVLDIGCWTGDLLASLGPCYQRFGVEPAIAAARVATSRGIGVLGPTVDSLASVGAGFDAVVMVDVIEHIADPLRAIRSAVELLRPGGFLLVTTGNRCALTWRLMALDYWYYSSDHITFLSPQWCNWAAARLGLPNPTIRRFSHRDTSLRLRGRDLCAAVAFRLFCPPRPSVARRRTGWRARLLAGRRPGTVHWMDHMLVIFEPDNDRTTSHEPSTERVALH